MVFTADVLCKRLIKTCLQSLKLSNLIFHSTQNANSDGCWFGIIWFNRFIYTIYKWISILPWLFSDELKFRGKIVWKAS